MTKIRLQKYVIGFLLFENQPCQAKFFIRFINCKKCQGAMERLILEDHDSILLKFYSDSNDND